MAKPKRMPKFDTPEQEAEFWDTHSPLDYGPEPKRIEVAVKAPKDRPITIRLDSSYRTRLEEMAKAYKVGPSTLSRLIITHALDSWKQQKQIAMVLEDGPIMFAGALPKDLRGLMVALYEPGAIGAPGNFILLDARELQQLGLEMTQATLKMLGIKVAPSQRAKAHESEQNAAPLK